MVFRYPSTQTCIYEDISRAFAFIVKKSALRVASTMTPAVTSRARLQMFAEKRHSPAYSEVPNGPVTKISYLYVCSNPNTFLVHSILHTNCKSKQSGTVSETSSVCRTL